MARPLNIALRSRAAGSTEIAVAVDPASFTLSVAFGGTEGQAFTASGGTAPYTWEAVSKETNSVSVVSITPSGPDAADLVVQGEGDGEATITVTATDARSFQGLSIGQVTTIR